MFKTFSGVFVFGWLILFLIGATNPAWDNKMFWVPPISFFIASLGSLIAATEIEEQRVGLLILAALSFVSCLAFVVFYVFFVFGVVGRYG